MYRNINKNKFNNYLINVSCCTRVLFFQKLLCCRFIPVFVPISVSMLIRWNPNTLINRKEYVETQIFIDLRSSQCFQKNDNAIPSKQLTLCTTKLSSKISNHASQANSSTSFISLSYGRHWTSYCNHSSCFNNFLLISCSVILFAFSVTVNGLWAFNTYILCFLLLPNLRKGKFCIESSFRSFNIYQLKVSFMEIK